MLQSPPPDNRSASKKPKCPGWKTATKESDDDPARRARIFISYKRNCEPDEEVAKLIFTTLNEAHDVFTDKFILVGTDWAECIETKLRECDFLITLLSANSINSEMVKGEIEKAHNYGKKAGHPAILPVRLAYTEDFPYALSPFLNPLQWTSWNSELDTPRLTRDLMAAISGATSWSTNGSAVSERPLINPYDIPHPLPAASLELPEGTIDVQSRFYIQREVDELGISTLGMSTHDKKGVTISIKAPRQMGKSSLLLRLIQAASKQQKRTVLIDFQLFGQEALSNEDSFYRQFCTMLTLALGQENKLEEYWNPNLGNQQRCTNYVEGYLLKNAGGRLLLAMDEVERVFDTNFRSDFFSMLRHWHNNRAQSELSFKNLDMVLVTSTEPYQLIENLNQSPFNVGQILELTDFTPQEVHELNKLHGSPLTEPEEKKLQALVNGHPYLVRRALYLVAMNRISASELFAKASKEQGPFGDHLRYHLFRIFKKESLVRGMREVLDHHTCADEDTFFRLRGAGLIRKVEDYVVKQPWLFFWHKNITMKKAVIPRCQLYADYFGEHLNG